MPPPTLAVVHPLVLLSAVDHYFRVAKDTRKRVVGFLLGETFKGRVDITNSYAVPFEEDDSDTNIWFLDHNFHENMLSMFRKVNAKEKVVGWYSTGPKIRSSDVDIHELVRKYCPNPIYVIIRVQEEEELGLPTEAYYSKEDVKEDGSETTRTFVRLPTEIGAFEAEEIGVEHLLRDVKDTTISTVAHNITSMVASLKCLNQRLKDMEEYMGLVAAERIPPNHQIFSQLQDIFSLLPNLRVEELVKSFAVKTNDMMVVVYLSSLIRCVVALHNVINNKLELREKEKKEWAQ